MISHNTNFLAVTFQNYHNQCYNLYTVSNEHASLHLMPYTLSFHGKPVILPIPVIIGIDSVWLMCGKKSKNRNNRKNQNDHKKSK